MKLYQASITVSSDIPQDWDDEKIEIVTQAICKIIELSAQEIERTTRTLVGNGDVTVEG